MRRPLALVASIVAGLLALTPSAQAKFVVRLVFDGPGLVDPVELPNSAVSIGCTFSTCHPVSHPPDRALGPAYNVTQVLEGHGPHGPQMDRIVHVLYPYVTGGPRVFTAPGQTWHAWTRIRRVPGGWTRAPRTLMKTLRAHGLPAEPPVERIVNAATQAEETQDRGLGTIDALVGVGVLMAAGAFLSRPQRRKRSSRA